MMIYMVEVSIAELRERSCILRGDNSCNVCSRLPLYPVHYIAAFYIFKVLTLLIDNNIRVPESDLRKINRTSVPLNDKNGGFLVTLEVFHHLHCLNQLRKHAYYEYYYPDINKWNSTTRFIHVNHCIENLRRVLMCQADVSLVVSY